MKKLKILSRAAAATFGIAALALFLVPAPASADQVINDDLIVTGSVCVGFDCVNGESFGFDTVRLKENNLRIKADDTSSTASFPQRDWQLTFNESANGGLEKFSIDDITAGRTPFTIEGNASSHSLYVDDGGRVGFGTSTPVVELHVKDGDTPTLRLEQDGSSGFTPQTWDVAGNETNFFVRDATNGSTLPFRIRPGAASSSIDIKDDSSVEFVGESGIGDADLHVKAAFDKDAFIGLGVTPDFSSSSGTDAFIFGYNGAAGGANTGRAIIATRPTSSASSADILFLVGNSTQMTLTPQGLNLESTCIELSNLACTASSGAGFNCVVGSCP